MTVNFARSGGSWFLGDDGDGADGWLVLALCRTHFGTHGLCHTHAAELREEGVDIGVISKQLGHLSIATTARYLDHIAPWDVVKAMAKTVW